MSKKYTLPDEIVKRDINEKQFTKGFILPSTRKTFSFFFLNKRACAWHVHSSIQTSDTPWEIVRNLKEAWLI